MLKSVKPIFSHVPGTCEKIGESGKTSHAKAQRREVAKKTRHLFFPVSASLRLCVNPFIFSHVPDTVSPSCLGLIATHATSACLEGGTNDHSQSLGDASILRMVFAIAVGLVRGESRPTPVLSFRLGMVREPRNGYRRRLRPPPYFRAYLSPRTSAGNPCRSAGNNRRALAVSGQV